MMWLKKKDSFKKYVNGMMTNRMEWVDNLIIK